MLQLDECVIRLRIELVGLGKSPSHTEDIGLRNQTAGQSHFGDLGTVLSLARILDGQLPLIVGDLLLGLGLSVCPNREITVLLGAQKSANGQREPGQQRHQHGGARQDGQAVFAGELLQPIGGARRPGNDRFVVEMPLEVGRQAVGRLVTSAAILFQALHHNPVQVAPEQMDQPGRFDRTPFGRRGQALAGEGRQLRARADRLLLPDRLDHRVQSLRHQFLGVEGGAAGQQLVEQHPQAIDVAARINVQPAHLRLLRAHVGRRAHELVQLRVNRRIRQAAFGGFGNAEINHLGHGHAVEERDEDVGRLDVPMDNPLLVGVLDGLADVDEQVEPLPGAEVGLIAVVGDADAADQLLTK